MVKIWLIRSEKKGILFNLQMNIQYVAKRFNLYSFPVSKFLVNVFDVKKPAKTRASLRLSIVVTLSWPCYSLHENAAWLLERLFL